MVRRLDTWMVGNHAVIRRCLWPLVALLASCTAQQKLLGPGGPPEIPATGFARAAFLADVDVHSGRITISAPSLSSVGPSGAQLLDGPSRSLVGGDAVLLTTYNFSASAVGAFQPGKVRVTFDIALTNRLTSVQLVGPTTFPAPPAGTTGPLLFPYDIAVATTSGGVSGSGGDVIVVLPGGGLVAPSSDWDGAPFNFFNDSSCSGNDCFPWEEFSSVAPGGTTASKTVGFDLDPTVGQFTARLIVASDLLDTTLPQPGTVQGVVTSAALGPIVGALVTATPGGITSVTGASGSFSLPGLAPGTASLDVTGLPTICTQPSPLLTVVSPGTVTSVTVTVSCVPPPLLGTLSGQISLAGGLGLGGVGVVVTPNGGTALPMTVTDPAGAFSVPSVPVSDGTGTVTLIGLPPSCTDPGPLGYNGMTIGGTSMLTASISCQTVAGGYPMTVTVAKTAGTVTLTLGIDMSPYNDLLINGVAPDDIQLVQGQLGYDALRLQPIGCAAIAGSAMSNLTVNGSLTGVIQFLNFTTAGGPVLGAQGVLACDFADLGGGPMTTATLLSLAQSFDGHDLLPRILVTEGTLP